jgi:hypothetical protein
MILIGRIHVVVVLACPCGGRLSLKSQSGEEPLHGLDVTFSQVHLEPCFVAPVPVKLPASSLAVCLEVTFVSSRWSR